MTGSRQGRLVVLVNGALSVAIVLAIGAVSVFRPQTRPPGIAEFAPAAGRPFTTAPKAITACRPSESCRPPAHVRDHAEPLPLPVGAKGVASALSCYAWPNGSTTQTFDPQSPPCLAGWDVMRGNGGATTPGVSATAIRVGVTRASVDSLSAYAAFFSTHFQLYGRTIQLVPLGRFDLSSAEGQHAAATRAQEQQVFATIPDLASDSGPAPVPIDFLNDSSSTGVIALLATSSQISTTALSGLAPYAWSYPSGLDQLQRATATLFCNELAGRPAAFADRYRTSSRRLAVMVPDSAHNFGAELSLGALTDGLATCHTRPQVREYDPTSASRMNDVMLALKRTGVTTVVPFADTSTLARRLMPAAEATAYRPEWLLPGTDPSPGSWQAAPARQLRALFGLAGWSRNVPSAQQPVSEALGAVRRGGVPGVGDTAVYHGLLMLASGAQLAGPRLTPRAFADGLSSTSFGNPGAGAPPTYQAGVGLDDADHAMVNDVGLAWWSSQDGEMCLVGNGARWIFTDLPENDPGLFVRSRGC